MKPNFLDGKPFSVWVHVGLTTKTLGEDSFLELTEQRLLITGVKEDELADAAADEVRKAVREAIQLVRRRAES